MKPGTDTLLPHPDSYLELPADRKKSLLNEIYGTPHPAQYPLPLTKAELESLIPEFEDIEDQYCDMNYYSEVYEFDNLQLFYDSFHDYMEFKHRVFRNYMNITQN